MRNTRRLTILAMAPLLSTAACAAPRYPTELAQGPPAAAPLTTPSPAGYVYARPPGATSPSYVPPPSAPPISTAPVASQALAEPAPAASIIAPPAPVPARVEARRETPRPPIPKLGPKPRIPAAEHVTVTPGLTLYSTARRAGMSVDELAAANGLRAPYTLKLGRTLMIPPPPEEVARAKAELARWETQARRVAEAKREDARLRAADRAQARAEVAPQPPAVAVAEASPPAPRLRGDDAPERVSTTPPIDYARPPNATPAPIRPTRRGAKTVADARAAVAAAAARAPSIASTTPATPTPLSSDADVAEAGRGRFIWPLHGSLISGFGPKGPGLRNDGLDLAASFGAPVRAAAAGEVVYAGGAIPAFGNLVLVKHPGGWVTAYAHLNKIAVAMRQTVAQGQEIGEAGETGTVDQPQLHFEVRYTSDPAEKAQPIDPALVLPQGR